ncbi:hypothetical protein EDC04DRAFT_2615652 [Pisolithus marmoratus]|nr:hypothetical protein EDC04DRAFT_2615652 [Pisolithus marmoratus]
MTSTLHLMCLPFLGLFFSTHPPPVLTPPIPVLVPILPKPLGEHHPHIMSETFHTFSTLLNVMHPITGQNGCADDCIMDLWVCIMDMVRAKDESKYTFLYVIKLEEGQQTQSLLLEAAILSGCSYNALRAALACPIVMVDLSALYTNHVVIESSLMYYPMFLCGMGLTKEWYQVILKDLVSGENLNEVGVPEGFGSDMMGDKSVGVGVNVNVKGMSDGMSNDMGMGLEEESGGIREVKRDWFKVLD